MYIWYYIVTQKWKKYDIEIEIVKFVMNWSVKMTIPPDWQECILLRCWSVALYELMSIEESANWSL